MLEMLIVLSIVGIMLLLVVPFNYLFLEKEKEKNFIDTFASDILFLQAHTRTSTSGMRLSYYEEEKKYKIYEDGTTPLIVRELPKGWEIRMRKYEYLSFSSRGAVSKLGTIVLKTKRNTYKFIFSLGKGRFRIEKE